MRRFLVLLWTLSFLGVMAAGCDDDPTSPTDTESDTGVDSGVDLVVDTVDDTTEDIGVDVPEPDVFPDIVEDNYEPVLGCVPSDCTETQACVGGECVDPVDNIADYAAEAAENPASFFWTIQLPSLFDPPERCCFDYTGDGRNDDTLGTLLGLLGSIPGAGDINVQDQLDLAIDTGQITLVTEWRDLPIGDGDVRFSVFMASNDSDNDGFLDNNVDEREAGQGTYALDPTSFGDFGSMVQFNLASKVGDTLFAGPSDFELVLDIGLLGDEPLALTLRDAQIVAPIAIEEDGVHTVDTDLGSPAEGPDIRAGGQLGGVVEAAQILSLIDEQMRICAPCDPGITSADNQVLGWAENETLGTLDIFCCDEDHANLGPCTGENAPAASNTCTEADGIICGYSGYVCSFGGILGGVLDVDYDGDDINDSLSAGLRFGWTGATISTALVE